MVHWPWGMVGYRYAGMPGFFHEGGYLQHLYIARTSTVLARPVWVGMQLLQHLDIAREDSTYLLPQVPELASPGGGCPLLRTGTVR